ncbi:BTB/POZ domain-containing protein KCTD9-like [Thalassophryne amazonica]|uniref:BTB/POZ domain-containing protein KCTD9-like n=1 Tax=Thalassophryne amazonica TaxID=390379 RepID=UPI00147233C2|nr:BTB/POZ domain-containing protein KCTD9-like [Thalassophryne amazonica]XP_034025737.1 BTB/POZ domain-containing protein KCTD9-like [Thalassophryne amazonica]
MLCTNAEGASLKGCNYEDPSGLKVNLEGANLKGVEMEGSQMTGINLRVATLKNAKLKNCNLRGATLAGTDFEGPIPKMEQARKTICKKDKPKQLEAIQNHVTRFCKSC